MSELSYTLPQLLNSLVEQGGSDLHLSAYSPPRLRLHGQLLPLDLPPMTEEDTMKLCYSVMTDEQKKNFETNHELDMAFTIKGLCRFRANFMRQKGFVGGVFRVIPTKIKSLDELGMPPILRELCMKPRGLVLVTGPTGSGKSTTLASMLDFINSNYHHHIITIEDPVEFIHPHKKSVVNQREVGSDTNSFNKALKSALRQDPDVVLVGELRDIETISMALTTAETGHLVFGTLHTNSSVASINRLIDAFPHNQQAQIRTQVSMSLAGVISQLLVPTLNGKRSACLEIMIPNAAIRNLIRDDKVHQVYSSMQIGQDGSGMQTMNQGLLQLVQNQKISTEIAMTISHDPIELESMLQKIGKKNALTTKAKP